MKGKKAISSKFPTYLTRQARIKKIMQEDEEIGKVAQGTPIVISRALELFLKDIIVETADIARTTGSKKLQPWHVKRFVAHNRQYDFLDDLVQSIPDPTGSGGAEIGIATGTSNLDPKSNGKGKPRSAAATTTNSGKASPASQSPAVPSPVSASALPTPGGVITSGGGGGARGPPIDAYPSTHSGSGKGPSNASVILNSPINNSTADRAAPPGPILSRGGLFAPPAPPAATRAPETAFDDYDDDEDDDDDDDYDE
ncbi:hypothetical protein QFC21_000985 [Naganishia friedmannii]|uniref:Uncharacterized protein n=1 Tax=Naganishia friedmannii TaxID=89922 RepID=A0ACC2W744_9TREE|nr:hypothetical protein QFC21_000985 [Naganishia friedmannii]